MLRKRFRDGFLQCVAMIMRYRVLSVSLASLMIIIILPRNASDLGTGNPLLPSAASVHDRKITICIFQTIFLALAD